MDIFPPMTSDALLGELSAPDMQLMVGALHADRHYLAQQVHDRDQQLVSLRNATLRGLLSLAQTRDADTGNHLRRSQHYVRALATQLRDHPKFAAVLAGDNIEIIAACAVLHDIGKVGIPDRILNKPGAYGPDEFDAMKRHTVLGRDTLRDMQAATADSSHFFDLAGELTYSHHEKWDGSGYPLGLAGEAIPLAARLMTLADVYDSLISARVYKAGQSHDKVLAMIVQARGTHFDPDVVDAFLACASEFQRISDGFASRRRIRPEPSPAAASPLQSG